MAPQQLSRNNNPGSPLHPPPPLPLRRTLSHQSSTATANTDNNGTTPTNGTSTSTSNSMTMTTNGTSSGMFFNKGNNNNDNSGGNSASHSRNSKSRSRTVGAGRFLALLIVVYVLVYKNLRRSFVMMASTSSTTRTNDEDPTVPWRWDAPHTSTSLFSHRTTMDGNATTNTNHHHNNNNNSPSFSNRTHDSQLQQQQPSFHIYWMTRSITIADVHRVTSHPSQLQRSKVSPPPPLEALLHDLFLPTGQRLDTIVTHIPWWTKQQVEEIYRRDNNNANKKNERTNEIPSILQPLEPRLILKNNITLKDARLNPKPPTAYSFDHAARLLTHLEAIALAHSSEHEYVLFLEDDALLTQHFVNHWWDYASLAPKDWTVLQWATSNTATLQQSFSLPEPWISWLPDLWGTHAYTMRRTGMEATWKHVAREKLLSKNGDTKAVFFTIDQRFNGILLADELLFSVPDQVAYTSTFPWILSGEIRKTIDRQSDLGMYFQMGRPLLPPLTKAVLPQRKESLLVFMNIRFSTYQRMAKDMNRALLDVEAVCQLHRDTKCDWIIHGAFTKDFLFAHFQQEYQGKMPPNIIHFKTTVGDTRFNKFGIMADHLSLMKDYDLVLLKDNDQRLAGFQWSSFLDKKGTALVAGPLRQAPDESFLRTKIWEISQHYKLHDSRGWKMKKFAPWSTPLFVNATVIEVHFLEMYFNVFDGPFAEWFFSKVLTKNFTEQDSCWGPDLLWCPAAVEFAKRPSANTTTGTTTTNGGTSTEKEELKSKSSSRRMGCALVPLVSVHEDTRQIFKDGEAFNDRGYAAVEQLRTSNKRFERWYDHSWKYARGIIAWRQLDAIGTQCRKLQRGVYTTAGSLIDFPSCIAAGMKRTKII